MIEILHLTAHLGGGIGKALSTLVAAARDAGVPRRHVVACLEPPEKRQFVERIVAAGGEVLVQPAARELAARVAAADIVQLEWWNHPATIEALCRLGAQPMRLLVWCHVSGLFNPIIPPGLLAAAQRFVFTSPCSLKAAGVRADDGRFGVIASACGPDAPPPRARVAGAPLAVGYLGSLNFAKLHPDYVDYLAAVPHPDFRVRLIGDELNRQALEARCRAAARPHLLEFGGYTRDVAGELAALDVLAYLLNPRHYGTAENALVEAMAMGVVPVVLDNPAERCIVEHGRTGLVVSTPAEFAAAIAWLEEHPADRLAMAARAAQTARSRWGGAVMQAAFATQYADLMRAAKRDTAFAPVFGSTAAAWFLSCQGRAEIFAADGRIALPAGERPSHDLLERSKGSVFHFLRHFPDSPTLGAWARALEAMAP